MSGAATFWLRVYYEDTDLGGIVFYANYLRFTERARTEALIEAGVDQRALREEAGLVFVVRRIEADYLAPARFQDRLRVTTRLLALGGSSIDLAQDVWRDETVLFRSTARLAAIGPGGRPVRVPEVARVALERLRADEAPGEVLAERR